MVAVGLWGAQLGAPAMWLLPVTFPLVMAFRRLPGLARRDGRDGMRPPLWLAALLVAFFAVFRGHAHGIELPPGKSGLLYSAGFVVATGGLHAIGIAIGLVHRFRTGRIALQAAGAMATRWPG